MPSGSRAIKRSSSDSESTERGGPEKPRILRSIQN